MLDRLITMIPGVLVAAISWILFWTLLATEAE